MQALARGGYSAQQVMDVLHAKHKPRNVRFRYDLLDRKLNYKRTLKNVLEGEVAFAAFATIKRTGKFKIEEEYIPAHVGRVERTVITKLGSIAEDPAFSFNNWVKTDAVVHAASGDLILQPYSGTIANNDVETGWRTVNIYADGWMAGGFIPWWSPTKYKVAQGGGWQGSWAQEVTRLGATQYAVGMQTGTDSGGGYNATNNLVSLSSGQQVYASFYFRTFNGEVNPNYLYAMGDLGNFRLDTSVTYTPTGYNGWVRCDAVGTCPSGRATGTYGLLIACDSAVNNGICNYDNIYFGTNKPIYSGMATSPVIDVSNTTTLGSDVARVKDSVLVFGDKAGTPTREGSWMPPKGMKVRYSTNGGTTWSAWTDVSYYGKLVPAGTDATNLRVQLQYSMSRWNSKDDVRLGNVQVSMIYEEDQLIPKADIINYASDRLKPYMEIEMQDGNWIDFPLGVFLLNSPTRIDDTNKVHREVDAYDQLIILRDIKAYWNHTYTGNVVQNIRLIMTNYDVLIDPNLISIPPTQQSQNFTFPIGTPYLEMINTMLEAIGYYPLWVDANGIFRSSQYISPASRPADYKYFDDELSVTYNGMESELDLFETANAWVAVANDLDGNQTFTRIRQNNDQGITSIKSVGRIIVDYREAENIKTQAALDAYVDRLIQESTASYGKIRFKTALMPMHEYQDILHIRYSSLDIDDTFGETAWKMQLKAGGEMEHEARRVVYLR